MGGCVFNYVLYMPSSLPLLHIAMPTPCLNTFGIVIPTSFYIFYETFFCLVYYVLHWPDQNERKKTEKPTTPAIYIPRRSVKWSNQSASAYTHTMVQLSILILIYIQNTPTSTQGLQFVSAIIYEVHNKGHDLTKSR